ncbi:succinate-semialdehyde dehydrogenase / glutarate-semialdehyde dehydrogenase [Natronoarchaeum philippinense]|uniref:Succinate-semialdehyde dehydrogenase / glutarate-semialdehyde dehydrogenase n=1 Tax=Natronoarchaeum philippinense TaxID=558529 RepID=A0A285N1A0_NATPI|nr:succinic semialdehyde dehydrogenase [Natronoarchaeum philippinense]SNZ03219.1 succinate-semialdehyde dehydrogenase / glutarate-semialdehyde dehydrogenase [Natronoarchaeum philippinense]
MNTEWTDPERLGALRDGVTATGEREDLPVEAPAIGETIGSIPSCTDADVAAAVERAREAQSAWADRSVEERVDIFDRFHDLFLDRRAEVLDLVQLETGKTRRDAVEEVMDVANNARHYGNVAPSLLTSERRSGGIPFATKAVVHRQPVGVVGLISPWNYPVVLTISDALPALLAGNAVVCKPAEETTYTALFVRELLIEAGLPADLFQIVSGPGERLGEPLIEAVDFVGFTGSTEVGREVAAQAGRNLLPSSLELGGKNPLVVLDDADPESAAEGAVRACFANAGQLCISTERLYVHEDVYDDFLDAFVAATRGLSLGAEIGYGADVGSMQSQAQLDKVQSHVEDAVEKGADVLAGGRARPDVGPYCYEPTVLTGVTPEMVAFDEETFGPAVAVYEVESVDEAVERANDSEYGLNASVWTGDPDRGERVAERIECGTVNVNEGYVAAWASVDAPMGGMGDSGIGRRHGDVGLTKYTEAQTVATQRVAPIAPGPLPDRVWASALVPVLRGWKRLSELRRARTWTDLLGWRS